jgi:uncharacterized cupredoxin-like copper-binding protein
MTFRGGLAGPPSSFTARRFFLAVVCALTLAVTASAQPIGTIRIEMTEFAFRPAIVRIAYGHPTRLLLVNRGQIAHQFDTEFLRSAATTVSAGSLRVDATGLEFVRLDPGGTAQIDFVPLRRGRFPFACSIEGHTEAGMKGILDAR